MRTLGYSFTSVLLALGLVLSLQLNNVQAAPLQVERYSDAHCQQLIANTLNSNGLDQGNQGAFWRQIEQQLAANSAACYHNANYLALFGAAQMHTGKINQAQDTLERALLLNPKQGRARIDYAQVLYLQGQPFAAYQLNQQLLDDTSLPEQSRQQLQQRQTRWQERFKHRDIQLNLALGYDSNINSAADITELELTPVPGEVISLPLADPSESQAAATLNAGLNARWHTLTPNGVNRWQLGLQSQHSEYPHDQQQLSLSYSSLTRHHPLSQIANPSQPPAGLWQSQWKLGGHYARYNNKTLYQSLQLELSARNTLSHNCQINYPLQLTGQFFPSSDNQRALLLEFSPALACRLTPSLNLSGSVTLAYNQALQDRTGGDRQQLGGQLQLHLTQGRSHWFLTASQKKTQDKNGYSPLLDNNSPRQLTQRQIGLAARYPISPKLSLNAQLVRQDTRSNLSLFSYQRNQAQLGLSLQLP